MRTSLVRIETVLGFALVAGLLTSCYDFHLQGPEDPSPVGPRLVEVTIEYRQPQGCLNAARNCDDPVWFSASWMIDGGQFRLKRDPPTGYIWRGVAKAVPVNFPPRDDPHAVRVYDPHLAEHPSGGITASRLTVGGQLLTYFIDEDRPSESALVYIDDNGFGHNPY
jgi:hypothetical protein